jgi:hypothetical protein
MPLRNCPNRKLRQPQNNAVLNWFEELERRMPRGSR